MEHLKQTKIDINTYKNKNIKTKRTENYSNTYENPDGANGNNEFSKKNSVLKHNRALLEKLVLICIVVLLSVVIIYMFNGLMNR